jgi:hypothetical protein
MGLLVGALLLAAATLAGGCRPARLCLIQRLRKEDKP